ncbi:hypothetical protein BDV12DRAFT_200383 [Aspergillus spectabilis]
MSSEEMDNISLDEPSSDCSTLARTATEGSIQDWESAVSSQIYEATFDAKVERPQSLAGEALFVAVICSSQLLTQAGLALSMVPQHYIGHTFGVDDEPGKLSWFSAGYSLTVGTFILIAGRLGDVFGHKTFFVGGYVWFGLWSAVAGFAAFSDSYGFFVFCRTMQGIGPAFLLPNAIAILGRCYDPGRRQNMIFSLFGATAPGGFLLGAVFSSLLTQMAWWPWSCWILCFACLLLAGLGSFIIPTTPAPPPEPSSTWWQRTDTLGSITGVSALLLFNFAWNQGPVVGWPTAYTYIILLLGIFTFGAFVFVEKRLARHPLIPFATLPPESVFTLACIAAGWSSFGIFVFYACNVLEVLRGQTPLLTSAQFSPIAVSGLCAAITTGLALTHLRASSVMLISMTAFLTGGIILATVPIHQSYWAQTFVGILVLPWGMDMSFPAATIILSRAMPRAHQGVAASLVNTFVNYSISIGLGVAGTVEGQVNREGRDLVRGFRGAFYVGVGLAGLGVALALTFCFVERVRVTFTLREAQGTPTTVEKGVKGKGKAKERSRCESVEAVV